MRSSSDSGYFRQLAAALREEGSDTSPGASRSQPSFRDPMDERIAAQPAAPRLHEPLCDIVSPQPAKVSPQPVDGYHGAAKLTQEVMGSAEAHPAETLLAGPLDCFPDQ